MFESFYDEDELEWSEKQESYDIEFYGDSIARIIVIKRKEEETCAK